MDRKKVIKIILVLAVIVAVIVGLSMIRGTKATISVPAAS